MTIDSAPRLRTTVSRRVRDLCVSALEASVDVGRYRTNRISPPGLSLMEKIRWFGHTEEIVVPELGPCHIWSGGKISKGYPIVRWEGKITIVTRVILGILEDKDVQACHRCDNPPCINPEHLFPGTRSENALDKVAKGRHIPYPGEGKSESSKRRLEGIQRKRIETSRKDRKNTLNSTPIE
jgi:hypothetical protein